MCHGQLFPPQGRICFLKFIMEAAGYSLKQNDNQRLRTKSGNL